jgi:hypothetical protein
LVAGPRWAPDTKTDWPTDCRLNVTLTLTLNTTTPVFERTKIFHALDHADTVIGLAHFNSPKSVTRRTLEFLILCGVTMRTVHEVKDIRNKLIV